MIATKPCKFECGTLIQWDTAKSIFVEQNGEIPHTKDRCLSLKQEPLESKSSDYAMMYAENIHASQQVVAAIRDLAAAIREERSKSLAEELRAFDFFNLAYAVSNLSL